MPMVRMNFTVYSSISKCTYVTGVVGNASGVSKVHFDTSKKVGKSEPCFTFSGGKSSVLHF